MRRVIERPDLFLALIVAVGATVLALLVIALSALSGAGAVGLASMLAGLVTACVRFFAEFGRVPLPALTLVALASVSAVELVRVLVDQARQQRAVRSLPLERISSGPLFELALAAGARRLYVTSAARPAAFCFGLLRPGIVVTAGLLDRLGDDEQAATIWHEAHHARQREPLRRFVGSLVARTLFWLPCVGDLLERYRLLSEIAADREARSQTSKSALAGALAEVAGEPTPARAVGFADFAEARVDRLFDPAAGLPRAWRPLRVSVSLLLLTAIFLAAVGPAPLAHDEATHLQTILLTSLHRVPLLAARVAFLAAVAIGIHRLRPRSRPTP